jgi:hypothetical protein
LKRFIDDIAIEVIESKLISALLLIFSPITVVGLTDETVARIAGESEEIRSEREQLVKKLEILMKGFKTCEQFVNVRVAGKGYNVNDANRC